jgi:hypothetical protein
LNEIRATKEIKALSAQEIDDLLKARGMALARAAELTVIRTLARIEMAVQLGLTPDQYRAIREIKARVDADATPLGSRDRRAGTRIGSSISPRHETKFKLDAIMMTLGSLQARLRSIHLASHLETKALISTHQIVRYNELRGYGGNAGHDPAKQHDR